ncbi:non-ribosomal peptide synthetase, partial [Gordonia lacunae]
MTSDTSIPRASTGSAPSSPRPSALRSLALAATHAGDDIAMTGAAGPVSFRALHRRVSASAITLAGRGVAPDAALRATVTALMPRAGLSGSQLAATAAEIVDELDRRLDEILGDGDRASLPGLIRIAARRRADAVALTDLAGASLTYRELDERSEQMAHALVARGAGPETLVGVALPRSADLVVALLAVLRTGAAYLPLDRTHPVARLTGIVDDASPVVVLAEDETVEAWAAMSAPLCTPQDLLTHHEFDAEGASPSLPDHVNPHASAYVMYTSGSTGRPKGVVVTHDNVVSLLTALDTVVESTPDDVWSLFHSYAFDVSVGEIWAALRAGGHLLVLDHATTRAPDDVVDAFDRHGVTVVNFTPSSFYQFAAVVRPPHGRRLPESVRRLHFSGELLDYEQVRKWQSDRAADGSATRSGADVGGPQLNNMYGPTETTVYMTRRELTRAFVDGATASDIGTPLLGSRVHVLDGRLAPVPDGVPGELYVSGAQVTRGFLHRHGQTATRYVADPFGPPGGRMYRTGDVGVSRGGSIEFVGRRDGQVKLRGFRIELGEVESAMSAIDGVDAAGADIRTLGDTDHLVGYLVATGGSDDPATAGTDDPATAGPVALPENEIRARLATAVPDYMVPTRFVWLPRLPLTVNGKLDRGALPDPGSGDGPIGAEPPATATEAALAGLVAEILGVNDVGVTTSLFDLGGNSLTATRVAARAAERFDTTVSARAVFADPTIRGLAAVIDDQGGGESEGAGALAHRVPPRRIPLARIDRGGVLPLSPAQRRIWFLETLDPGGAGYLIPAVLRLSAAPAPGPDAGRRSPDPVVVAAALADLLARHEVLRTRFVSVDGVPEQVIAPVGDNRHDVRVAPPIDMRGADEADISATIAEITSRGFDLEDTAPVRARLLRVAEDDMILVLVVHHIISDGGSVAPMVTDFVTAYEARLAQREPGWAPLPVHYADYAVWQHHRLGDTADPTSLAARQLEYWRAGLAGAPELIELPVDRLRAPVRDDSGAELSSAFDAVTWNRLRDLAGRHGATMFMVVHALLAVTLVRSGADEDIVIGTPVAGRGERDLDPLIGMFVNTLALRSRVSRDVAFTDLLDAIRDIDVAALDHADLPFETVVDEVVTVRNTAHPPLVQVALAFQNATRPAVELPGLVVAEIEAPVTTAKVDLQVTVLDEPGRPADDDTRVIVTYATALFDADTVDAFLRRMVTLARAVTVDPNLPVGDLPTGDEASGAVVAAPSLASSRSTLADLLDTAISVNPGGVAVTENGRHLTYGRLDVETRRLAAVLRARGAGPGTVIALATPRSLAGTVGFWAVARTGAAVAPVDPALPVERLRHMLDTVDARLGIASAAAVSELTSSSGPLAPLPAPESFGPLAPLPAPVSSSGPLAPLPAPVSPTPVEWILVEDHLEMDGVGDVTGDVSTDVDTIGRRPRPDETAYVIFTSGSTGRPKGVAVTHRGLADLIADARVRFDLTPAARVLRFAAPGFDAAVFETLVAVASASTMVVVPDGVTGGAELAAILRREHVTHATITPTALATVSDVLAETGSHVSSADGFPDLEVISVAGDVCSPELVRGWSPGRAMRNLYGPTETTIWATSSAPMRPDSPITIGGPIAGITVAVLDPRLHPVPAGVAGELYLAGAALAAGYLGQTALTAERFVAAPFGAPGERMYRTGDLVRWRRRHGRWALDFLGRSDFQVKIRGFRIELGEIDAVLGEHESVDFSTTAGVEHPTSGETVLVSWVHGVAGIAPDTGDVAAHAARRLPAHMVPTLIVPLDEIPLTATGKLDSRALPTPRFGGNVHVRPETATEQTVAAVYAEVLGLDAPEEVSAEASFFDLGGTSLSATRVMARLGVALGVEIPVRALFETPTVRALAAAVDAGEHGPGSELPALEAIRRPHPVPLSYAQRRMWFLNQFDPGSTAYVIPIVVRVRGDLDVSAMCAAILDVVDRHEVLRTVYPTGTPDADAAGPSDAAAHDAGRSDDAVPVGVEPVALVLDDWAGRLSIGHTVVTPRAVASADEVVDQEIHDLVAAAFDVTTDLPVRARVVSVSTTEHVLVIALHHIAADGESAPVLAAEIAQAYRARRSGRVPDWPALRFQYADYAVWQRHRLGDVSDPESLMARQLRFWAERLTGLPDVLPLPTDRPRPAVPDGRAATVRWSLPASVVTHLRRRAAARRATLFMVAHTATAAVLARLTSTTRIAVATPVAGRGRAEIDQLIGMFVNTVVLSVDVEPHLTVAALLDQVKNADLAAFDNTDVPFERVIDAVNPRRIENVEPLAQVLLVHTVNGDATLGALDDLDAEFVELEDTDAKFDLAIGFRETADGGLAGSITYATALFDQSTAETISSALCSALDALAADADLPVADIPILTTAEAATQQQLSIGRAVTLPDLTVPAAFAVADHLRSADAIALRCDGRSVTSREFAARVATLARELIGLGIGPEDCVVVCMPRSVEMVVAVHAVLAAGGQYMPVAPDAPTDRVRYMVDTSRATIALVCDARVPAAGEVSRTILVDAGSPVDLDTVPVADHERRSVLRPEHAAYTIFTSGSTGRPKGVTVSHRSVLNRLRWGVDEFGIGPDDSILLKTPATFDVSVPELLTPALTGARLVIAPDDAHLDPHSMARLIDTEQITTVHFVPSLLAVFVGELRPARSAPGADGIRPARSAPGADGIRPARSAPGADGIRPARSAPGADGIRPARSAPGADGIRPARSSPGAGRPLLPSLRHLYCSGEALPPAVLRSVRAALPHVRVSNLFGPTEAAVEVTAATPDADAEVVPIGRPVWNTRTFVLDERLRPVPAGITGELYLGGVQLARGYAARPDLTAERFVADPAGGGARLYRTGDLVRRNRAGELEYLGRSDFQVKLRGQRIELGEIEAVLATVDGVRQAVVTVASAPGGSEHLVGYLIAPDGGGRNGDEVVGRAREAVTASLPAYMRPTLWVPLAEAPLGSTGKLDRKSLPRPRFDLLSGTEDSDSAPVGESEQMVAAIVASVLGLEDVPLTRSFFELGGDSIASIRLTSMLRAAGLHLTPRDVFTASTIRELAGAARTESATALDELPGGATGPVELTPGVAWMLELADEPGDLADFSQSTVLALPAEADEPAVRAVVAAVAAAHPMLAASFRLDADGSPTVLAGDGDPDDITVEILDRPDVPGVGAGTTPSPAVDDAVRAAHSRALATLSPADGRLLAAVGVRFADGTGRVVVAAHHLGVDAVSWPTIVAGLGRAWWQYRNGESPALVASGTSFRRWAGVLAELADRTAEIDWWTRQLPSTQPPELTVDRARDRLATTVSVTRTVEPGLAERVLGTVTESFGARPDTVLAAAVAHAVRESVPVTGPVSMMIENHGREESIAPGADLAETVGWFTSFVPVSVDVPEATRSDGPTGPTGTAVEATPGRRLAATVKALKDTRARMPDNGIAFGPLRWSRPDSPLRDRPLPPITVNYLGLLGPGAGSEASGPHDGGAGSEASGPDVPGDAGIGVAATEFVPVPDAPSLPPSVRGDMVALAALTVTAGSMATARGRELRVDLTAPAGLLDESALAGIADRWEAALSSLTAYVDAVGDPGPSETDVIGGSDQADIDHVLAARSGTRRSRARCAIWPPTPLQHGLFYEAERLVGADPYVTQSIIEFDGDHPVDTILPAIRELLARQRVLRSGFTRTPSGRLVVVVPPSDDPAVIEPDFRGVDLSDLSMAESAARIVEIADEDLRRPFVLDDPPLIRFSAVSHDTVTGPAHTLVITAHHIILDGWSGPILVADLLAAHLGRPAITPAGDFESYLEWLDGRDRETAVSAWREHLVDVGPTLLCPQEHRGADARPRRHEVTVRVPADRRAAVERTVRRLGTTTSTVLYAAWSIVLSRFTGERRVVFGETVSGRPADLDGADGMIGLFINTVPVTADVDPRQTLAGLIGELHRSRARMLDHQFVGLGDITASTGHPRLFDTLVVFESYPVDVDTVVEGSRTSGLEIRDVSTADATHYPLALIAAPEGDDLCLTVKADLGLVGDGVAEVVAATLADVLDVVIDDPTLPVAALDPMPAAMRSTVEGWSRGVGVGLGWSGRSVGSVVAERVGLSVGDVAV